ncbi:MAG: hypothetical protein NUW14_10080 [Deltaproteobacteria bacterium]|nr:hypothetical protein [Deltaproteobacteria bacterium]
MTTPTPTGAPINVLVVDDESNIRKTLGICLEAEGHHVTAGGNFQDAAVGGRGIGTSSSRSNRAVPRKRFYRPFRTGKRSRPPA